MFIVNNNVLHSVKYIGVEKDSAVVKLYQKCLLFTRNFFCLNRSGRKILKRFDYSKS